MFSFIFTFTISYADLNFLDEDEDQPTKEENEEKILELIKKFVEAKTTGPAANPIVSDRSLTSKKILKKLEGPVTIEWDAVPLSEAVDELREMLGINIMVHKSVPKDESISINVKEMKGLNLVKWFLKMNDLRGSVQDGVLMILPKSIAPKLNLKMKIYNLSDLTTPIKNFKAPTLTFDGMLE